MRAYYASKLTKNISTTPEGYLICRNVPIARTGPQNYLRSELGELENPNDIVEVLRTSEEVFSKATIASFEGKPLTDDHPYEGVNSDNATQLLKGVVQNVRQGTGEDDDKLLADIIIYERFLADEVKQGKRELSCGYESAVIKGDDGKYYQVNIRGNHVAVVDNGRAGHEVRIRDRKPEETNQTKTVSIKRRTNSMAKKGILEKFFGMVKDADPDDLAEVVEVLQSKEQSDNEPATPAKADSTPEPAKTADQAVPETKDNEPPSAVMEAIKALTDSVKALSDEVATLKSGAATDSDPLEALEQALESKLADNGDEPAGEGDVLVDPEQIDEDGVEKVADSETEVQDVDPETDKVEDDEPVSTADTKAVLKHIRDMKPFIAGIKDAKAKKRMTDSLASLANSALGRKPKSGSNGYHKLLDAQADTLKKKAKKQVQVNDAEIMQSAYDSRNPHKQQKGAK